MRISLLPEKFTYYLLTQSCGAFNDNFFKMLLQLFVLQLLMMEHPESIIAQANMIFTVPFVLFGPWAGYLADRFSKTRVMQFGKLAEVLVMIFGVIAFALGSISMLLAVLFFMAVQSTFFGPAKYGFIAETCDVSQITPANSWVNMTTFFSIIFGTAFSGVLFTILNGNTVLIAACAILLAGVGWVFSLGIPYTVPAGAKGRFPGNPIKAIHTDIRYLGKQGPVFLAALASAFFMMLSLVFHTNIIVHGKHILGNSAGNEFMLALLPALLGIGIAIGSVLAKRWSGRRIEPGLIPLGALGLGISGLGIFGVAQSYPLTAAILIFAGICGGLYIVPLNAFIQYRANKNEKGRVLAAVGMLNGLGLVAGTIIYQILAVNMALPTYLIFLIMGFITLGATAIIISRIPDYSIRFFCWLLTHSFYRIRVVGRDNVPESGPLLLAPNHVTYLDAFFIGATQQRFIRFFMQKTFFDIKIIQWFFRLIKAIPVEPGGPPENVARSISLARQALLEGHAVCIFPEGKVTRDGALNPFRQGCERIVNGVDCPVIPVYIHNGWGSLFSFDGGRILWKLPRRLFRPITIYYGEPLDSNSCAGDIKAAIESMMRQAA